jgi:hypothetical protein
MQLAFMLLFLCLSGHVNCFEVSTVHQDDFSQEGIPAQLFMQGSRSSHKCTDQCLALVGVHSGMDAPFGLEEHGSAIPA